MLSAKELNKYKTHYMGPLLHFTPYTAQRDRFLQFFVIVDEMWVNHTPETTRASITVPDVSPSK